MPRYLDDEPRSRRYDDDDYPRRRYRDHDYDDDDYEDRLRRRRRRNSTHGWLIVLGVLGFIVVSGAAAFAFVVAFVAAFLANAAQLGPEPEERQEAMGYSRLISRASDRLHSDFKTFDRAVQQALDQGGKDSASVRTEHEAVQKSLDDTIAEMRTWIVPNSHTARSVDQEFRKYMRRREIAWQKLAQVPVILDDRALTLEEKRRRTENLLREWDQTDQNDLAQLHFLQGEMADEFEFPFP